MTQNTNDLLTELLDREKIRDCMMRYAQSIDRLDSGLLETVYWPDAHDWHGDFEGNAYDVFEKIIPYLREHTIRTQHFLGGSLIRFVDSNHADVETYSQNFHTVRNGNGSPYDLIQGGRYLDKLEKRGQEWRIIDRIVMIDWVTQSAESYNYDNGVLGSAKAPISARRPDDLMYSFLGDIAATSQSGGAA
ncbi:nuclear transport factor 2 family protein [Nocardia fusca]|uniref:nuclear transport factor 2 family protein n=1 Tax=Nocardia fusca TaxID=941183 RepID=UPI0007A75634|nr:nuclear transport factor 2 family protein [Nocardia fusca]